MSGPLIFNAAIAVMTTASFLRDPSPLFFFLFGVNCFCIGASAVVWTERRAP